VDEAQETLRRAEAFEPDGDDYLIVASKGGTPTPPELTPRDLEICARLGPYLKERGLTFVGIDVIGPYLTEINVTSPTGIRQVKAFGGPDIAAMIWDVIEKKRAHAA
ncbi:MAG: hypothetical protein J0H37_01980, partial [Hyphomicrobium denitrificans]|nr:hypothetical protein [Hyphomicrobium denitrificans]